MMVTGFTPVAGSPALPLAASRALNLRSLPRTESALPPPLWGRVGEGGSHRRMRKRPPPSSSLPHRKSGLPDLRIDHLRNPGRPGFRGGGNDGAAGTAVGVGARP